MCSSMANAPNGRDGAEGGVRRAKGSRIDGRRLAPFVWCSLFTGIILSAAQPTFAQSAPDQLPGTRQLTISEPLDEVMVAGINRFALRALQDSRAARSALWRGRLDEPGDHEQRLAEMRARFATIIGAVDERVAAPEIELIATLEQDSVVGRGTNYVVHAVRWKVLEGVSAEGLLLQPNNRVRGRVVALPDADWTPEMSVGLQAGTENVPHIPAVLAEGGMQVLVPMLINRDDTLSGHPKIRFTNQPHREFIYRMAFEMGRHVIGYEVQKILAAVDSFEHANLREGSSLPIGVCGVGEGALLALYASATDPRIDAALVSGYFQTREGVWREPIYRNVWSLLRDFGDAEIAALIAPRALVVEACAAPTVDGPPAARDGRSGAAPGRIEIASIGSVREEFARAQDYFAKLNCEDKIQLTVSGDGHGPAGVALAAFVSHMGIDKVRGDSSQPIRARAVSGTGAAERQRRQFAELVEFTQRLLRHSARARDGFWSRADRSSVEGWERTAKSYREHVWEEMIGKLPPATLPANPQTRLTLEGDGFRGYEVVLDVYPDVIASGILLLPDDLNEGERRPVVVCQHGLEGTPMHTITREADGYGPYKAFSAELAKRGFIVYAPQNPYRGRDRFRTIQRKSNPMRRSLFSYIIRQHEQTLNWLAGLPYVDPQRIAFYGLSYGGKTAVRVPPLLDGYCLSICSADFDEWVLKNVSSEDRYSYMFTGEYEMFEWNMGHVANYAELSTLMAPRPFMVERGHDDGVAPDEWVAWEYAKVRRHYVKLGIGERTEIEFFNGPHTINGQGTFAFLHKHLQWPAR